MADKGKPPVDTAWVTMTNDSGTQRTVSKRVWFHRVCAIVWVVLLIPAYLWWRDAIFFVIAASIYANVKSDWAASEAADDTTVMAAIDNVLERLDDIEALFCHCERCRTSRETGPHTD